MQVDASSSTDSANETKRAYVSLAHYIRSRGFIDDKNVIHLRPCASIFEQMPIIGFNRLTWVILMRRIHSELAAASTRLL